MAEARRPRKKKAAARAAAEPPRPLSAEELRLQAEKLRRQAEERLAALSAQAAALPAPEELTAAVHELRVHQVELEMQNEELRRAQLEAEALRAKYFELFDLAPVGYLTLSDKGLVEEANSTAAYLLGVERQALVGRPFSAFVLAPDQDAYYLHFRKLKRAPEPESCELRLKRAGAEPFWAHLEGQPQYAGDGEPRRYHLTFTDVPERALAQEKLRRSESELRAVLNTVPDAVFLVDRDYRLVFANEGYVRATAATRGRAIAIGEPVLASDYPAGVLRTWRGYYDRALAGASFAEELSFPLADGMYYTENHFSPVREAGGEVTGVVVTSRDVTERREAAAALAASEEYYKLIAEHASDVVVKADVSGVIEWVSPSLTALSGWHPEELIGQTVLSFLHPDDLPRALAAQPAARGGAAATLEARLRLADGSYRWVASAMMPVLDEGGAVVARVGAWRDVQAERAARQALVESEDKYRYVFDRSVIGKALLAPDGLVLSANDALCRMLGRTRDEVEGHLASEFNAPDDVATIGRAMAGLVAGDLDAVNVRARFLTKEGAVRWADVGASLRRDAAGEPLYVVASLADVTAEVEAAEEITRLQAMRDVAESVARVGSVSIDLATREAVWSPEVFRLLDMAADEGGADFVAVLDARVHPGDREQVRDSFAQAAAEGIVPSADFRVIWRDGSEHVLHGEGTVERDDAGTPLRAVGFLQDVTERRAAEVALRAREEQLASAVDGSGVGLWDWYPQTGEETLSERWAEILGYTLAELAPISIETWRSLSHPDDLRRADELLEEHFAGTSAIYSCEGRMRHKDGHWVWVLDRGRVSEWDADGRPLRMIGTELDISGRKRAEEELRFTKFIVERGDDGIFWMTADGALRYANPSTCELLGYSLDELRAMTIHDIDPDFPATRWPQHIRELAEAGSLTFETRHRTRDGTIIPMEITATYLEYEGDFYDVAFARDIRERKLAEEAVARLNDELVAEAAALTEAYATIARIAATDDLTGLANRRRFNEVLEKAVSLARRHGSPLALVSVDLDGMKGVNDSAGHEAGDKVLKSFATLLTDLCRREDLPARLGGDEFGVVLPGNDVAGALGFAERVLAATRSCADLATRGVTMSGGVAALTAGEPLHDLLRRADQALYAAKHRGGDRVAADG